MRGLKFLVLGVAVAAGVGAVALVKREIDRARLQAESLALVAPAPPPIEARKAEVLVAARAMRLGETLREGDLRWQPWPYEAVAETYVTREADPEARASFEGSVVRSPIVAGEPISSDKVLQIDHPGVMSALIRDGLRAYAVTIQLETGVGGFALPGDFVDVILSYQKTVDVTTPSGREKEKTITVTQTLVRQVRVLAVDQVIDADNDTALSMDRTATLEVTPDQAELLSQAISIGRVSLALRGVAELITKAGEAEKEIWPELAIDPSIFAEQIRAKVADKSDDDDEARRAAEAARAEAEARARAEREKRENEVVIIRGGAVRRSIVK